MSTTVKKATWAIDPIHSTIRFDAKYLMITSVSGWFMEFEGTVVSEQDCFANSEIQLTIYAHSLNTGNDERDNHLRSADFFDAKQFPVIQFRSNAVTMQEKNIHVSGVLSVKNIEHPFTFTAIFLGFCSDPLGNAKAAFEMDTVLNRKDFNITWNQFFDKNGLLLSDEVKVHCDLQLLKLS
ncbi:YceI family protein [Niastella caeni]|uniref:YceI family protein n=1 Tax=Niastella caeni TaxID=2569763 RepID=A0A4S8HQ19_9BACT|nr:YceI family protein [Niastella caeni]THU36014.1 YceI family protein [Niastella caeni]